MEKAGNGFANLTTSMLEIPKSIINTTNESNIIFGFFGGMLKGTVNMVGRMGVGLVDLVTAPIPTQPIVLAKPAKDSNSASQQRQTPAAASYSRKISSVCRYWQITSKTVISGVMRFISKAATRSG